VNLEEKIQQARNLVKLAKNIVVLTGAGVSADSGIPTFRGKDGLWKNFKAEELATPEAFDKNPVLVWEWYNWRREKISKAKPNPAHYAIAQMERNAEHFILITQNVDGLHPQAGSKNVIELHGNIWRLRCVSCANVEENKDVPLKEIPPRCRCGSIFRPDVVWFGEIIPHQLLYASYHAIEACDVMLVIGTSAVVQPAASMGIYATKMGKKVIELNLEPTPASDFYYLNIYGRASELVPKLL
jgi:NAD-dependent deacetylase